jgi:hypothetical protein
VAEKGDEWALQKLLSRPTLLPDAEPYYAAFVLLSRDRAIISIGMGAALPRPVPRDVIRREGERLGYDGDALDDFVEALTMIDDFHVETEVRRAAAEAKASSERERNRR